jgi:hypothetical protein
MNVRLLHEACRGLDPARVDYMHAAEVMRRACALSRVQFGACPPPGTQDLRPFMVFLQVWAWLQARAQRLSMDFPEFHYGDLSRWYPAEFAWLQQSRAAMANLRQLPVVAPAVPPTAPSTTPPIAPSTTPHAASPTAPPAVKSPPPIKTRPWNRAFAKAVLRLFHEYRACANPMLHNGAFDACRAHIASRVLQIKDAQDALETSCDLLLDLVPAFARAREITTSTRVATGKCTTTLRHTQLLWLAATGGSLQASVDAYSAEEAVEGGFRRRIRIAVDGQTALIMVNQPYVAPFHPLAFEPVVVINGQRFTLAGALLLCNGHFTALALVGGAWVLFNDQRAAAEPVPDVDEFLQRMSTDVRLVVMRAGADVQCPMSVNMPNLGNSCYINAVLQLLFHCDDFVAHLERELRMTDTERATRALPALLEETRLK